MYSPGPVVAMQIDTTRPWLSNAIDPQSRPGARYDDNVWGERPRGPDQLKASVCQPSSWISDSPFGAMNGLCGTLPVRRTRWGVAGAPEYAAGAGTATDGIGTGPAGSGNVGNGGNGGSPGNCARAPAHGSSSKNAAA